MWESREPSASPTSRSATPDPARPQQLRVKHTAEALATKLRLSRASEPPDDFEGRSEGNGWSSSRLSTSGGLTVEALVLSHGYSSGSRHSLLGLHSRSSTPPQSPQVADRPSMNNHSPLAARTPMGMRPTPDSSGSHESSGSGSSLARRGRSVFNSHLSLTVPEESADAAAKVVPMPAATGGARSRPANLYVSVGSRPGSADVDSAPGGTTSGLNAAHGLSIIKPNEAGRPNHQRHGSYNSSRPSSGASLSRSLAGCTLGVTLPGSSRPSSAASSVASCTSMGLSMGCGFGGGGKQMSQRKLVRLYDSVLSEVAPRILVGADEAARDLPKLREAGVTHVVNCAAATCANHFEDADAKDSSGGGAVGAPPIVYLSLFLQDSLREDISRAFYDSIEFIDEAISKGGTVLIHCQHGVSRSATIAMAHLMWRDSVGYEDALERVRSVRPTVNPNIGFACALLAWQGSTLSAPADTLAWELDETGALRPLSYEPGLCGGELLDAVLKSSSESAPTGSDGDGVPHTRNLVFQRGEAAACWTQDGSGQGTPTAAAISGAESRLRRFHRLPSDKHLRVVCASQEDEEFWRILGESGCSAPSASLTSTAPQSSLARGTVLAHPSVSAPKPIEGSAGSGSPSPSCSGWALGSSDTLVSQMQAAALQHLLIEISLALPATGSCNASYAGSLHGSRPGSTVGSQRDATPLASRSIDSTDSDHRVEAAALSCTSSPERPMAPLDLRHLNPMDETYHTALSRLRASRELLAQPVLPEHSNEVRQALAWLLHELLPEIVGTYLAPLAQELKDFVWRIGVDESGVGGGDGPLVGEELLAAEELLVARIQEVRDYAEAELEAAIEAAEGGSADHSAREAGD